MWLLKCKIVENGSTVVILVHVRKTSFHFIWTLL